MLIWTSPASSTRHGATTSFALASQALPPRRPRPRHAGGGKSVTVWPGLPRRAAAVRRRTAVPNRNQAPSSTSPSNGLRSASELNPIDNCASGLRTDIWLSRSNTSLSAGVKGGWTIDLGQRR